MEHQAGSTQTKPSYRYYSASKQKKSFLDEQKWREKKLKTQADNIAFMERLIKM